MPRNSITQESTWLPDVPAQVVLATAGTVDTSTDVVRVAPAAAVTGVILSSGAYPGQRVVVVNTSVAGSTITMAAQATSHVADGVTTVIPGLRASAFWWDGSLWYRTA